jgi:hypothetical protein
VVFLNDYLGNACEWTTGAEQRRNDAIGWPVHRRATDGEWPTVLGRAADKAVL